MFKRIKALIAVIKTPPNPNWYIEKAAKPSRAHPLGGFWKQNQKHNHGLAIGKAPDGMYYISFCGPGGCFAKGEYRPNSKIVDDPEYIVIDNDTIEVKGKYGFSIYTRSISRDNKNLK